MHVNHAQLVKYLLETLAKHQDQCVIATKNTTKQPTYVTIAPWDNSQEIMLMVDKIKDAKLWTNNVTLKVKSNSDNNNAMDANNAQVIKYLLEMHAKSQDQSAYATNNTMLKLTDVINAEPVNFLEMDPMLDKMEYAKMFHNNAIRMVKSN